MSAKTGNPRPLTTPEVHELLGVVSSTHGMTFVLAGEMSGGDGPGAWALTSEEGPAVLKFLPGRDEVADLEQRGRALEVLRARGYPAPKLLCFGTVPAGTYIVQERLPGSPIGGGFTPSQLDEILRLHDLHADIGVALPGEPWPLPVTRPIFEGADGFCVIESMRAYSPETDAFLDEMQQMTREHVDEIRNTTDLVHFDFQYANILGKDGCVTGVIDWEAAMLGDRGFDLAAFAYYVFDDAELRQQLLARVSEISGLGALRVYLAHIMFRQIEWCTRFYGDDLVRFYLDHSRTILDELPRL
jgi:aminoglycoside phosphotransferase (APT) family kinase protein